MIEKQIIKSTNKYANNKIILKNLKLPEQEIKETLKEVELALCENRYDHLGTNYYKPMFIVDDFNIMLSIIPRIVNGHPAYIIQCDNYKHIIKIKPIEIYGNKCYDKDGNLLYEKIIKLQQAIVSKEDCILIMDIIYKNSKLIKCVYWDDRYEHRSGGSGFPVELNIEGILRL